MNAREHTHGRMPDFIIIGAQKSGTTSVFAHLRSRDEFFLPRIKEVHYFNRTKRFEDPNSLGGYLEHFSDARPDQIVGEATPEYLSNRMAASRMHRTLPDARLVALLRHPVDRAHSAYWHARRVGAIPQRMTFEEALERESRECGRPWTNLIATGCYVSHIERFLAYYRSDQMLIESFEELLSQPSEVLARVTRFISSGQVAPRESARELPHANRGAASRAPRLSRSLLRRYRPGHPMYRVTTRTLLSFSPKPPMDPQTRRQLLSLYRPWNERLWELLGRSWEGWDE